MDPNIIRSIIFITAGLIVIFFPKKVLNFQTYIISKLKIKHDLKHEKKYNKVIWIILIIIWIILLSYSLGLILIF